jgi:hypothetical protein
MLLEVELAFATYTNLLEGSTAMANASGSPGNGDPEMGVKAPELLVEYAETFPEPKLAA